MWLFKEIPKEIKENLKMSTHDKGIDILVYYKDNTYKGVQCKYRTNINNKVNEINTFFTQLHILEIKGIFMTNSMNICKDIRNVETYCYDNFKKLDKQFFKGFMNYIEGTSL